MAYLIFSTRGKEWDRRELSGPAVMGRSADCEISVHDILLSRRHCRFTPIDGGWLVTDLASRNGTIVTNRKIQEQRLIHGDVIRVGKMRITFCDEAFVPARTRAIRPTLPPEIHRLDDTLSGTVVAMEFSPRNTSIRPPVRPKNPVPRPRPRDPDSFETDDLYSMLEQIASSSWDSIYSVNAQPLRRNRTTPTPPTPMIAGHPKIRPWRPEVSMTLQAIASDRAMAPVTSVAPKVRRRFARLSRWISRVGLLRLF